MKDCFARRPDGTCGCLAVNDGCFGDCPFRKSVQEHERDTQFAAMRLSELPEEQQTRIANNYYSGQKVWINKKWRRRF